MLCAILRAEQKENVVFFVYRIIHSFCPFCLTQFHSPDVNAQSSSDGSQKDDISSAVVEIINAETNGQPTR
jgi:hypothetical protein